jgi:hypothetical protein
MVHEWTPKVYLLLSAWITRLVVADETAAVAARNTSPFWGVKGIPLRASGLPAPDRPEARARPALAAAARRPPHP